MRETSRSLPPWHERIPDFIQLMRLDRPIGILLLLWPTLWALWVAAEGRPDWSVLFIFCSGVVLMRSAGCVINDYADRKIDGSVERTKDRPLAADRIDGHEALALFFILLALSFFIALFTNLFTIMLSFGAVFLAATYPFMKRYTHFPQVVLGAAFAWSVPMSFAAQINSLPSEVWLIYFATLLWTVAYDTMYAMVDRDDDVKIGVKSTAIIFGRADKLIIGILQILTLMLLVALGSRLALGSYYDLGLLCAAGLFLYQQILIRQRDRDRCFQAFLNNNWVGMVIFIGLFLDYWLV